MADDTIYMSTTDTIPNFPNKQYTKSEVTWASNGSTMMSAYNAMEKWAKEHNYKAIIGVHFIMTTKSDGEVTYSVYGTAVSWDY